MSIDYHLSQKDEFTKFKVDIDLAKFVENKLPHMKYKAEFSSPKSSCYQDDYSKLLVYKKNGEWKFKDYHPPVGVKGQGSIIDLVQDYLKVGSLYDVRKELRSYMGNVPIPKTNYNTISNTVNNPLENKVSENHFKTSKLNNTKYLNERGITNDTIFSPTFNNKVRRLDLKTEGGKSYFTTVFPMFKNLTNEIVGLEQSNNLFNRSYAGSNKGEGFWKSNPIKEKPSVFIGESPIDLMAHYQLKNPNNDDNLLYIASFGELSERRIQTINNYLEPREHKIKDFILGMDNDVAGMRFNINMIGNINLKDSNRDLNFYLTVNRDMDNDKPINVARMSVKSDNLDSLKVVENKIDFIAKKELKFTSDHLPQYRNFNFSKEDDKHVFTFLMNYDVDAIKPLENVVKDFKNSKFKIERAISKDFAQDLEIKLGIKKELKLYGKTDDGKDRFLKVFTKPKSFNKGLGFNLGKEL